MKKLFLMALPCIMAVSTLHAIKIDSIQNNATFNIEYFYTKFPAPYPYSDTFVIKHGQKIDLHATYLNKFVHILYPNKLLFTINLADNSARFLFTPRKNIMNILEEWSPLTAKESEKERYDTFTAVMLPVKSSLNPVNQKMLPDDQIVILGDRPYLVGNKEKPSTTSQQPKAQKPYRSR